MTPSERQRRIDLEKQFHRRKPSMPTGRAGKVNDNKHFNAAYGKSCRPDNPPRVKGDASGRKVAVRAEGAGNFGYSPRNEDQGYKNGEKGAPCAINRQALAMEERIERKLPQWRRERRAFNAKGAPKQVILPGHDNSRPKKVTQAPRFVPVPTPEERAKAASLNGTWGARIESTFKNFASRW